MFLKTVWELFFFGNQKCFFCGITAKTTFGTFIFKMYSIIFHSALFCVFAGTKLALKYVSKNKTKLRSFLREYSLTAALGCSPFIIKVLNVLFETEDSYVFGQEYAPAGDLFDIIPPQVPQHLVINTTIFTSQITFLVMHLLPLALSKIRQTQLTNKNHFYEKIIKKD